LFFFLEAIFIAIYIYGWKRMPPRVHFWVVWPIIISGIGGTVSVVAANAWMNEPGGFTLNSAGEVTNVHPWSVIFNDAMPLEALHMVIAAYLVGGFLIASVYAVGMLRGRRDRYHRLGFLIPFTVACIAAPVQMLVGDTLARWVFDNEPQKFAAIELVPQTKSDVPEVLLGHLNASGTKVEGGIRIPGLASWLSDPSSGKNTVVDGRNAFPADTQPTVSEANAVHLAWDIMVGVATLLFLLAVWYALSWVFRRRMPQSKLFLWIASAAGVLSVVALEAGWVVTEVGRQPWIVRNFMKVEQGATTNGGVWITFIVILLLYAVVGTTLILVMRRMSRRWRAEQGLDDSDVPYGPSPLSLEEEPAGV
jgi:cytochrome d ubiquinol oxidase subunit I